MNHNTSKLSLALQTEEVMSCSETAFGQGPAAEPNENP